MSSLLCTGCNLSLLHQRPKRVTFMIGVTGIYLWEISLTSYALCPHLLRLEASNFAGATLSPGKADNIWLVETERLYGKDAHCPDEWAQWLNDGNVIPSLLRPDGCDNLLQYVPREVRYFCSFHDILFIYLPDTGPC